MNDVQAVVAIDPVADFPLGARPEVDERRVFEAVVSELNPALGSAREFVSILLEGLAGPLGREQTHYLAIAKHSVDQAIRFVNDLIDVTRLEEDSLALTRSPCRSSELVDALVESLIAPANRATVTVRKALTGPEQMVFADRNRLLQALNHVAHNALKFTPRGGSITVGVDTTREHCAFTIEDTGPGIAPADRERVFERLVQLPRADGRRPVGLGLGLPLARGLAILHGGTLTHHEGTSGGSRFVLTLPLDEGERDDG